MRGTRKNIPGFFRILVLNLVSLNEMLWRILDVYIVQLAMHG